MPHCDWGAPGSAEKKHWGQLEALCAAPRPNWCWNRNHCPWLLPWWPAWDGVPDAGSVEDEGGKYWLHGREAVSSPGRQHKGWCHPENIGVLRFFPVVRFNLANTDLVPTLPFQEMVGWFVTSVELTRLEVYESYVWAQFQVS